jgi:hypothetical protein
MPIEYRFDDLDLREESSRGDDSFPEETSPSDNPQCCSRAAGLTL